MNFILNIGLDVKGTRTLQTSLVKQLITVRDLLRLDEGKVYESDTEATLVIKVRSTYGAIPYVLSKIHALAADLEQDCIAVYSPNLDKGWLAGPRADAWGKFNPEFFILPNGSRLAAA